MDRIDKPIKFSILTLGCKVNQYESESLRQYFEDKGHIFCDPGWITGRLLPQSKASQVYIVNTCTVTQKAAMQSRQITRQAIRSNPSALVIVTGCYAQTRPEDFLAVAGVHAVLGHNEKSGIYDHVVRLLKNKKPDPWVAVQDIRKAETFQDMPAVPTGSRTRPFLKIQDGCSAFCTYCIVPHARGKSRSLPLEQVLEKIRTLKNSGCHEAVLTGIHLGAYGQDLLPSTDLYELLSQIRNRNLIERVRLSSMEPCEITDKIINLAKHWKGICPHFHIPLQSGDNDILKKMNRPYRRQYFQDLVFKIKERLPDAAIGIDCLIGFPGETRQAFRNTHDLIEKLPASYLHVFPFSPRKGTPAWGFAEKISPSEIKARCRIMRELSDEKKRQFVNQFIGKKLDGLIEQQRDCETGFLKAVSANYIPILTQGPDRLKNTLQVVEITGMMQNRRVLGKFETHKNKI